MSATGLLLRTGLHRAKPLLSKFGPLGAPVRDMFEARRVVTILRSPEEVHSLLADPGNTAAIFGEGAEGSPRRHPGAPMRLTWDAGQRLHADAQLRPGRRGGTEVSLDVKVLATSGGRPRYAQSAGAIALRALHRAKSLAETGEMPSLSRNPAGRAVPSPYGD